MATCPTFPRVPQEVISRFSWMRSFDAGLQRYGGEVCSLVKAVESAIPDVTDILSRIDDLEAATSTITAPSPSIPSAPAVSWDMGHIVGALTGHVECGNGLPLDEIFDMAN